MKKKEKKKAAKAVVYIRAAVGLGLVNTPPSAGAVYSVMCVCRDGMHRNLNGAEANTLYYKPQGGARINLESEPERVALGVAIASTYMLRRVSGITSDGPRYHKPSNLDQQLCTSGPPHTAFPTRSNSTPFFS